MVRENRKSELLSDDDNEDVFRIMGPRCQALASAVVQLYTTKEPDHKVWHHLHTGVLVLTKDFMRKDYFLMIFCLETLKKIWEHGIYSEMEYSTSLPYLHVFEGEYYMVGLNFASPREANDMHFQVNSIIDRITRRELANTIPTPITITKREEITTIGTNKKKNKKKNKKRKQQIKINKSEIGPPCNFQHVSHVGFDKVTGFSYKGDAMEKFLEMAGITKVQLQDEKISKIVNKFFDEHGGQDAVLSKHNQYARTSIIQPRMPPPLPPSPPKSRGDSRPGPGRQNILPHSAPIPPPPPGPKMPPPPPIRVIDPPEEVPSESVPEERNNLLSEIRQGIKLKPAGGREVRPHVEPVDDSNSSPPALDMVSILKAKLNERREFMDESASDSYEENNDDEWSA